MMTRGLTAAPVLLPSNRISDPFVTPAAAKAWASFAIEVVRLMRVIVPVSLSAMKKVPALSKVSAPEAPA